MPIFDQGYQHWQGRLSGHAWRWLAVTRQGVRAQMKNRFTRLVVLFALLPAIALAMMLIAWGLLEQQAEFIRPVFAFLNFPREMLAEPRSFRLPIWNAAYHFFFTAEMFFFMILVMLVGPGLISQDLRFNAIPLYFSRPLRRIDYFVGKLGVIGYFLALVAIVPAVFAFVLGHVVWNHPALNRRIGLCPEQDAFYEWMTGWDFIYTCARLSGMNGADARAAAQLALEQVRMTENMNRAIRGYSKGMRQRTKIAQALVHDPEMLFLDEPFSGTDPVARREMMDIILHLAGEGKSVLVSSHVLYEVQSLTPNIILLNHGRLVAEGNLREIRDLIDKYPHRIVLVCNEYRALATKIVKWDDVEGVKVMRKERSLLVETHAPDRFYSRLPELSLADGTAIEEVYSDDDNLEAVFKYLVHK
jgi:ABC-2 type transport system ATP-binding protein